MVVGIEPFGHLHGSDRRTVGGVPAARHFEVNAQVDQIGCPVEPRWYGAYQGAHIENMIVQAKIVGWNQVDPSLFLL
jgi:hypothetical protein